MSEIWEQELDNTEYECCDECGQNIYNGEPYYEIGDTKLCEDCMKDKYRRFMDYDDYTYQDYLVEKYESEKCDA